MGLGEYKNKRHFNETPEPKDVLDYANKSRFVIQRHRASHLHYDLRLEMEGVLKSWAIPKGPSMNPDDKRLAVQTEDHPVAYINFEGVIPKGNYGAGKMTIWDEGHYASVNEKSSLISDYLNGSLKIIFHGKKIKGSFALVRSSSVNRENQWLLIKHKDGFATNLEYNAEDFNPETVSIGEPVHKSTLTLKTMVKPMLASPGIKIFNDPQWLFELKYDGYRAISNIDAGNVIIYTRNGINLNTKFELLYNALQTIEHSAILDGEIVLLNAEGLPQFNELQNYEQASFKGTLVYYIFDLLHLNGYDLLNLPLTDRKELLRTLIPESSHLKYCDHVQGMGIAVYERAVSMGFEGIIAKRALSKYNINFRSPDWLKFKKIENTETIICGYTQSKVPSRKFASLILGMVENGELVYVGTCGSGFSDKSINELYRKFEALKTNTQTFKINQHLKGRKAVWLRPQLVCEVKFLEWTASNVMRQPIFLRLREDKTIGDVNTEVKNNEVKQTKVTQSEFSLKVDNWNVSITNPDKIYWPEEKITKYDMLDYYIKMSDYMLPYLKNRPESLLRHPNGIHADSFYQKDQENLPDYIESTVVASKSSEKTINYLLCQNRATLLYMNNLGCIEIHPWHSTIFNLDNPDYAIIDLDPSAENTFEQVIETALVVKAVLDRAKIKGFCKTSGASGLHIYIPMGGQYSYEEARDFMKLICYFVQKQLPSLTTMERSLKKRGPKIYLDYLQNRKGQTIVSAFSLRAQPNATVSMPLKWSQLTNNLRISDFNILNVPNLIKDKKDFFKDILNDGIDLNQALVNLEIKE